MNENPNQEAPAVAQLQTEVLQPDNPMSADAMEFIYGLGKANRDYTVKEINGAIYVNTDGLTRIDKYEPEAPAAFGPRTLSGLVDWLKADVDKFFEKFERLYVHVSDVRTVEVLSPVHGAKNERDILAECAYSAPDIPFNRFISQEEFLIMLQTRFCEGPNRDALAGTVGNLRISDDIQLADDGVSQRITVKSGVASVADVPFKNPVCLAPLRTFPEVEQPSSPFIVRFKKEGVGIFEADGGAWKVDAITTVGEWLKEQLEGLPVTIIA